MKIFGSKTFEEYIEERKGSIDMQVDVKNQQLLGYGLEIIYRGSSGRAFRESFPWSDLENISSKIGERYAELAERNLEGTIILKTNNQEIAKLIGGKIKI